MYCIKSGSHFFSQFSFNSSYSKLKATWLDDEIMQIALYTNEAAAMEALKDIQVKCADDPKTAAAHIRSLNTL